MKELLQRFQHMEECGDEAYFDADEILDLLDYFENRGEQTSFLKMLDLGKRLHPNNPDISIRVCHYLIGQNDHETALRIISRINYREDIECNLILIECLCMLGRADEALDYMQELVQLCYEALDEMFEFATELMNTIDNVPSAITFATRGLALFPDSEILKEELCYAFEKAGELQKALHLSYELIAIDPYYVDYWYAQGRILLRLEQYGEAIDAFDYALVCNDPDPDYNLEINVQKAYALYCNESYEAAIECYLEILAENADLYKTVQPYLADCYMKCSHFEEAYQLMKYTLQQIEVADKLPIYKNYVRSCLETDRKREAAKAMLMANADFPGDLLLLTLQALIHLLRNEHTEGTETVCQMLQHLDRTAAETHNYAMLKRLFEYILFDFDFYDLFADAYRMSEPRIANGQTAIHQAFGALIEQRDAEAFCTYYAQSDPDSTRDYVDNFLRYTEVIQSYNAEYEPAPTLYLRFKDIVTEQPAEPVDSDRLSANLMNNKYGFN